MGEATVRVLIADDHALVRRGFRRLLEDDPRIQVVGEAGSGLEAVEMAQNLHPHVLLLDISMPELSGLEAAEELARAAPEVKLLVLSMYSDEAYVRQALRLGAKGYLLKDAANLDLAQAVMAVAQGQTYLSPEVARILAQAFQQGRTQAADDPYERLTLREKQILQLVGQGKANKEIASLLSISPNTVAVHRANLMATLGVHGTAELVLFAVKRGLVKP
ncbi:MAG TPA: response regulator transcription factor [Terriglobales bacterium]|jgi:DNA-binding NarL/FixJ family response regulator|nr:response regulator transcription factor [Terriglobales bacterium]